MKIRTQRLVMTCLLLVSVFSSLGANIARASESALSNGIYLVLRDASSASMLEPVAETEHILINDGHLLEPTEPNLPDKPSFVALSTSQFVPIKLAHKPTKKFDAQGKKQLLLELAPSEIIPLETFTRKNCGRSVAIVIGNQVVTVHKVREAITGGKMQITRCTDNGCDVLYTELEKSNQKDGQSVKSKGIL